MKRHQDKLQAISANRVPFKNSDVPHKEETKIILAELKRKKLEKQRAHEFVTQERNLEINRNNQKLLSKLVEISNGRYASVPHVEKVSHQSQGKLINSPSVDAKYRAIRSTSFVGTGISVVRSLNLGVRKRETERIERENQAFAKRLFEKQPVFDRK